MNAALVAALTGLAAALALAALTSFVIASLLALVDRRRDRQRRQASERTGGPRVG